MFSQIPKLALFDGEFIQQVGKYCKNDITEMTSLRHKYILFIHI